MNCFKHNDRQAVGICKSCGKGVCQECAAQQSNGLACKGECEERVALLNRMVDNNAKTLAAARYQTKSSGFMTLIVGVAFLVFAGLWAKEEGYGMLAAFFGCLGFLIIVTGILRLVRKSEYPAPEK
jgi:hypothetical protein